MKKNSFLIVSLALGLVLPALLSGCSGGGGKADVKAQIAALKSDDDMTRQNAAGDLGEIGKKAAPAVPALIEALKDKDPVVQRLAAYALGQIGAPEATPAIPALKELMKGMDRNASSSAYNALWAIDPKSADPNYRPIGVQ
ncbi:MAG: HEAT repeat domain-containing protein [Verrucomicrobia bacterium]|nr:HEAT repeat domain-containing protein [Verrucomicrobiota bacterium]